MVRSPIAGTFYRSRSGDKPLAEVGETVTVGQVLCVIEDKNGLNEIESEAARQVAKIHPGEWKAGGGEALFDIRSGLSAD